MKHPSCYTCLHDNGGSPCDDRRRPEALDPMRECLGYAPIPEPEPCEAETRPMFEEVV